MANADSGVHVAYFFFDDKEDKQNTATSCLSSLINQLVFSAPEMIEHATRLYISQKEQMGESIDRLWNIFAAIATDPIFRGRYTILDALDECDETSRSAFLDRLKEWYHDVAPTSKAFLKVLMTSRPNTNIYATLKIDLNCEEQNTMHDIRYFVANEVQNLGYEGIFGEKVRTGLEKGAGSMFLWAALVAQELKETPMDNVLETLELIPPGIVGLYTHLLRKIPQKSVGIARLIFMNVVHAHRQMSVMELAITCSVKEPHTSLSSIPSHVIEYFDKNIKLCGPILKIRMSLNTRKRMLSVACGDRVKDHANTIAEVQLVHQSAKEFLLDASISGKSLFQSKLLLYTPKQAKHNLAVTCLTYISFEDFDAGQLRSKAASGNTFSFELTIRTDDNLAAAASLLDFTAQTWVQLCREGGHSVLTTFNRLAKSGKLKFAFKFVDRA